jgi:mono/diheme cytochrome c family protein
MLKLWLNNQKKRQALALLLLSLGAIAGCTQPPRMQPMLLAPASVQLPAAVTPTETLLSLTPPTGATAIQEPAPPTQSFERVKLDGLAIYRQQYCGVCHELAAAESKGVFGPPHDHLAATAAQRIIDPHYQGAAASVEAYLRECLLEPQRYVVPGYEMSPHRMPSYGHLSAAEIDALVTFLLQQQ